MLRNRRNLPLYLFLIALTTAHGYSSQLKLVKMSGSDGIVLDKASTKSLLQTATMVQKQRKEIQHSKNSLKCIGDYNGLFGQTLNEQKTNERSNTLSKNLFDEGNTLNDVHCVIFENLMVERIREENISRLQGATGSEVPNEELRLQIEAASRRLVSSNTSTNVMSPSEVRSNPSFASELVESHQSDATSSEKFAMAMIPSQLPEPIQKSIRIKRSLGNPQSEKKGGLSSEEEIELAHMIQHGVKLHKVKVDFEEKQQRGITRKEWAQLANVESPSVLRRLVSSYRTAKNNLVSANLGLVYAVVRQGRYAMRNNVSEDEMIQEGTLGLIRAAELFDPDKGLRFSTYATIWIKGVLGNSKTHETIVIPKREKTKWNKIQRAQSDIKIERGEGGTEPTAEEISEETLIPLSEVRDAMHKVPCARNLLSLDHKYKVTTSSGAEDKDLPGLYNLFDDGDISEIVQMKADVVAALAKNLDPREARLIRLKYGLHDGKMRTNVECAECMGISRSRAQQLATGCLEKLREADDSKSLQEYLLTVA